MIRHIWSVLCSQSVIDKDTNNISLFSVLEQLNVAGPPPSKESPGLIPISLEVVSFWERIPNDQPSRGRSSLLIVAPSGETIQRQVSDVDLTVYQRSRVRGKLNGLPVAATGRYEFRVQLRQDDSEEWEDVAALPLHIQFETPSGSTT